MKNEYFSEKGNNSKYTDALNIALVHCNFHNVELHASSYMSVAV